MRDHGEVSLEDMVEMEQVAKELWQRTTSGTEMGWKSLSVREAGVAQPRTDGGYDLAQESRSALVATRSDAAAKTSSQIFARSKTVGDDCISKQSKRCLVLVSPPLQAQGNQD